MNMDPNDKREFPDLSPKQRYDMHAALQNHDHEKKDQRADRPGFRVAGTDPRNEKDLKDRKWSPVTGPFDLVGLICSPNVTVNVTESVRSTPVLAPIKSQSQHRSASDRRPSEQHAQSEQGVEPSQGAEIGSSPAVTSTGSDPSTGAECPSEVRHVARMMQGKYGFTDIRVSESKMSGRDADGAVRADLDRPVSWSAMRTGKGDSGG